MVGFFTFLQKMMCPFLKRSHQAGLRSGWRLTAEVDLLGQGAGFVVVYLHSSSGRLRVVEKGLGLVMSVLELASRLYADFELDSGELTHRFFFGLRIDAIESGTHDRAFPGNHLLVRRPFIGLDAISIDIFVRLGTGVLVDTAVATALVVITARNSESDAQDAHHEDDHPLQGIDLAGHGSPP